MRNIKLSFLLVGFILLAPFFNVTLNTSQETAKIAHWSSDFRPHGAYVDEIKFLIYPDKTEIPQAMLALQNGELDAYDDRVPESYLAGLVRDPNVEVTFTPSVRYRALTLNCEKFPLNIAAFRRAMAFSYDKYRANVECIGGVGQPQDSYIPQIVTEWEVESELVDHFYEADFVSGNRSLENAGFTDLDGDGWREYDVNDNGVWDAGVDRDDDVYTDEGGVLGMLATAGYDPAVKACMVMQEGLEEMGIRSFSHVGIPFPPDPRDVDINCWTERIPLVNPSGLLYDNFRTGAIGNTDPNNYYHFSNSTIDAVFDQMVEATTLEEVKTYAREANKLLTFEQPQIVVYNDVNIGAHGNDRFDGWFEFVGLGPTTGGYIKNNPYCATKVHLKESEGGPLGGTFKYSLSDDLTTKNCYLQYRSEEATVLQYIYETLWNIDPYTWDPIPGLAYDWDIEQTIASGDIRDGQKFTFYLYENESWHDGEVFTAADVNHSIYMWRDSPYHGSEMWDIYKVEIPDDYTIEFYVNETGYLEWADTTSFYITPEHIWRDVVNVTAYSPPLAEVIGTGPYKMDSWVHGEYISLLRHENWRWDIREVPISTTSPTHTDTISTSPIHPDSTLTTSFTSTHSSNSSTQLDTPSIPLPILQIFELGSVLFFVLTLVIIARRQRMD